MRRWLIIGLLILGSAGVVDFAVAQPAPTAPAPAPAPAPSTLTYDWRPVVGAAINTVLVLGLVQLLKVWMPTIRLKLPWTIPILAAVLGPVVAVGQSVLADKLGVPVDFSPLLAVFSGATATAVHQVAHQAADAAKS